MEAVADEEEEFELRPLWAIAPGTPTKPRATADDNDNSAARPSRVILLFTRRGIGPDSEDLDKFLLTYRDFTF